MRSLWSAKQRSLLALIGIVIGIGSVIAMVTVGQIVENEAIRQFREMGTDVCLVRLAVAGGQRVQSKGMNLEAVLNVPERCSTIKTTAPYVSLYSRLTYGGKRTSSPGLGVTEEFKDIFKVPVVSGRFISNLDGNANFCVLGSSKAQWLAEQGVDDPVGKEVVFADKLFIVVGVAGAVPSGTFSPYEINEGVMVPIGAAMRSSDRPQVNMFGARMTGHGVSSEADRQLKEYFQYSSRQGVRMTSAEELVAQMDRQMRMFTLLLGAIGSISLIVGGVGVMNVMLVSVSERRREIGIRRAIGAEQSDIQFQFIIESVLLSFAGGIIGLALGVGAVAIICRFTGWEFFVSRIAAILGIGVSAAVGVFFGYYPARQAARMSPIDALRS
ncbi:MULTISPECIES: ABC transporter permease [unclassified Pseudodesulfovibrio]|uniref:ABC transporter permease n=1 Tax=unclassified Pseudodesulfovibrio TaxID=2661612 RepID=UPI001F4FCDF0|nr:MULTISPECIES: ABC transporter permease [unclassified Pseudodesulfovibrio]MCJ2165249.1 ABC transporter permease [Pseudodesulfovibrio sp. S3-i]